MKKIVFCTHQSFPHGSALANFIENLISVLNPDEFDVYVIAQKIETSNLDQKRASYHIIADNRLEKNSFLSFLYDRYCYHLDKIGLAEGDVVVSVRQSLKMQLSLLKYCKNHHVHSIAYVAEWFSYDIFRLGFLNPRYWIYKFTIKHIVNKFDKIMCVSTFVANKYKDSSKTVIIPPFVADSHGNTFNENSDDSSGYTKETIDIIYSTAKVGAKDDLDTMSSSIAKIMCNKVYIHLTGKNSDILREKILAYTNNNYSNHVISYGWMEYDKLLELYRKTDFLFFTRGISSETKANFPSKIPEMMSYGIVPIVTNVGDCCDFYLKDGVNSILIEGTEEQHCIEALQKAIATSSVSRKEMKANARQLIKDSLTSNTWKAPVNDLFRF